MKTGEGGRGGDGGGSGTKLGIVRLGRAGGKTKYSLLDERDIGLVQDWAFEARTKVDRNGGGARIYAYCYEYRRGKESGMYVQDMLWTLHCGSIADGFVVLHKNCLTLDNRLDNLTLVPLQLADQWCPHTSHSCSSWKTPGLETSLYWAAIQQLPWDPMEEMIETSVLRYYNNDGVVVEEEDDSFQYYECRYAPCIGMEKELREFSICGRCQEARYCGPVCQQRDWGKHKRICRERRRPFHILLRPDSPIR